MIADLFATVLDCNGRPLTLDRPRVVGILNVTPDSFSDGGSYASLDDAVAHGLRMVEEGADMLDIGGESTRPGAEDVLVEEELRRVVPVIEQLAARTNVPLAIDTSKPEVMRAAVAAGAGMVNDVYALRREGALDAVAELGVPVCLMHMLGEPRGMQDDPQYDDVVGDVHRFLTDRLFACELAGIDRRKVMVDPGFGFGKNLEHNLALLRALERFASLGSGVYVGLSRKSMIGAMTGRKIATDRLAGSIAAAVIAVQRGARMVRVHDVAATVDALAVWHAVQAGDTPARRDDKPSAPRWPDDE
ncbi:dihydropteroate synthase [Dyella japonica]|uniref:Dihydropteroate synthase n=2 Tax=Dyella japonica TaxID=231455 RepID=A0ABV2JZZ2_9GAMM